MKKLISVLVAVLMLVPLAAACQLSQLTDEPVNSQEPTASAEAEETVAPQSADGTADRDAVVAQIGEDVVTYGEVSDLFDMYIEYFTYYGYDVTSDTATLEAFQDDIVNLLVQEKLIAYKATELGYDKLTEEQQAELDARVETELSDMDEYYREQALEEAAADSTVDVDARVAELILAEAVSNLQDENATYEDYVAYLTEDITANYYSELLQNGELADVTVEDATVLAKYTESSEADNATYAETPSAYKLAQETYESTGSGVPVMFVPEGYSRIYDIYFAYTDALPEEYTTNQTSMKTLKSEYQELAFADAIAGTTDNAARMSEILTEYAGLQSANDALYAAYTAAAKASSEDIYAKLQAGEDFKELMIANTENEAFTEYEKFTTLGMLIAPEYDCDDDWSDAIKAAFAELRIGEYSAPIEDTDGYHIIFYVGDEQPGVRELDDAVYAAVEAQALAELRETEWSTLLGEWLNSDIVTLHEELYRGLGKTAAE